MQCSSIVLVLVMVMITGQHRIAREVTHTSHMVARAVLRMTRPYGGSELRLQRGTQADRERDRKTHTQRE